MKITYISGSIIPSQKANSVHVMKMCQALGKQGNSVTLVTTKGGEEEPYSFYNVEKTFKLVQVNSFEKLSKISFLPRLVAGVKFSKDADVIYTRWLLAAFVLIILRKKNIIFEYHHFATSFVNRMIEKVVTKSSCICRHIFITNSLKEDFINMYPILKERDTLVLPDGADITCSEPFLVDNSKSLSCGYIGSFQKGKGVDIVVKIAEKIPSMKFHIVGGTEDEINALKSKTKATNIIWHGFLDQKKAMEILKEDIDIALLPNQTNVYVGKTNKVNIGKWTSPMKLFEYMAMGKAIIASDIPVLKEILHHKENGYLVEPHNISQWKEAICHLERNRETYKKIGMNAYQEVSEKYTWNVRSQKSIEGIRSIGRLK